MDEGERIKAKDEDANYNDFTNCSGLRILICL
jgi:hypothetical protein